MLNKCINIFFKRLIAVLVLFLATGQILYAQPELQLNDSKIGTLIGESVGYHFEPSRISIQELLNKEVVFQKGTQRALNLGATQDYVWLKIQIKNNTNEYNYKLNFAYPIIDEITFFHPTFEGKFDSITYVENKVFERRHVDPDYLFDIFLEKNTTTTFYVRLKMTEQVILPIYIQSEQATTALIKRRSFWNGIYAGVALIMFLYNLFIYFSTKDRSYLWYVGYVLFVGATHLWIKGFSLNYIHESINVPGNLLTTFSCMATICGLLFTRNFLNTRVKLPMMNKGISWLIGFNIIAITIDFFVSKHIGFLLMQMITSVAIFYILIMAYYLLIKKQREAYYFTAGWTVLLLGSIVFLAKDSGILPYNMFTSYSMQIASGFEMAILSLALAARINTYRKEKEEARNKEIIALKKNEELILKQRETLEQKVQERTNELRTSNDELKEALISIKKAQQKLIESEKMASLGQLTAGVAHEINNPINFVSANITPLKRGLDEVKELIKNYQQLNKDNFDKQLAEIKRFEEDIDYDYLETELSEIIESIQVGAKRTSDIVKSLKHFARADQDRKSYADVNESITTTLKIVNSKIGEIQLRKNLAELPEINCYPGKLNQILLNLFVNAIDAIDAQPFKEAEGILEISSQLNGKEVIITIKDNGIGIPREAQQKLFDPFYTTKEVGKGTGLGLSLVYSFIELHNGSITFETEIGKGTTFTVILPIN